MQLMILKHWGSAEYATRIPRWLKAGALFVIFIAMASDINYMRQVPWDSSATWFLLEIILTYTAIAASLFSAKASIILLALDMGVTFVTQRPVLHLIAACIITLVISALCRYRLMIAHGLATLVWASVVAWVVDIADMSSPVAFWWLATWLMIAATLIGLAIRFLVIRTTKVHAELRRIEAQQETIRKEERHDLARELHDVVAHHITVITMQVMARRNSHDPDQLRETLGVIDDSAREALSELRALLDVLRTDEEDAGDIRSLSDKIVTGPSVGDQVAQRVDSLTEVGIRVHKQSVDPRIESLPFSLKTTCARIVQESATNILKHARHGARCSIVVRLDPTEVVIMITNNRIKPRDPSRSSGYGLTGLRERVAAVGGSYTAGQQGDEWVVEAHIPVHNTGRTTPSSKKWNATQPETSETEQSVMKEKEIS